MTLALGTVLESRYRIAALLGQGGMGAVYRAHDLRLQQDVALKENRMASPASTRQFEREAVLMARLRHPNLPRVMDHFVAPDGAQYLVMDYIAGEDLGQILARNGPLDERLALAWIERVCDALAYLHSQTPPIVHRDIKPGNIKITPQGEVYLVDFGIAKVGDAHQRTTVGALGVTPGFSPPEQYGGGGTDPRSDIYALGATLYTLVTNECPPESVLRSIKMAALRPPQELRPDLSATVAAALESALATSPTDRPQSVEAFRALLRQRAAESPADHAGRGATLLKEPEPPADAAGPPWVVTPASAQPPSAPAHKRSTPSVVESPVAPQAVAATPAASTPQASAAPVSAPLRPPTPQGAATPAARVKKPPRARQGRLLGGWVWAGVAVAGVLLIVAAVAVALALTSNRDRALPTEAVPETGPTEETQPPAATGGEQPVEPEEDDQQAPDETPSVAPVTAPQVDLLAVYGHGIANSVAYAPDGRYLAVASSLGVHLFETGGNRLVYTFETTTAMAEVAFSHDSALIAAGGSTGGPVLVWRMEDAALVHTLEEPPAGAFSLAFAPNGRTLAMSSWGHPPRLWRLGTDEPPQPLEGTSVDPQPYGVAFSADSELVAGGCQEASVCVWRAGGGPPLQVFEGHESRVTGVAFAPNGPFLASASYDGTVRLWNLETGSQEGVLELDAGPVTLLLSVAYSPDGRWLAAGLLQATAGLWRLPEGELVHVLQDQNAIWRVAFSPDGGTLATALWDGTARVWRVENGEPLGALDDLQPSIGSIALSPDGALLAIGSADPHVRIWRAADGTPVHVLEDHDGSVNSVAFSPDGAVLASASQDGSVSLWRVENGDLIRALGEQDSPVFSVAYSPDGRTVAAGRKDATIWLWRAENGEVLRIQEGHESSVLSLAFSPEGELLASGSEDTTVRIWRTEDGQLLHVLQGAGALVKALTFSPDGNLLAVCADGGRILLWNPREGQQVGAFEGPPEVEVDSVAFSPDGALLAAGWVDGRIALWDVETRTLLTLLEGHTYAAASIRFSPDGRRLYSGSLDGTVRVWELR